MRLPNPLQTFLQKGQLWWNYYQANADAIRPAVVENIVKVLSCGAMVRGYKTYECSNEQCEHTKFVTYSCKSRFCPTCGKKATDQWVAKQRHILPQTDWQHITLTLPNTLWPLFKQDRTLITQLPTLAADAFLTIAKRKKINPAIFVAIHTAGRDLKWNVHIHLSITMGGLSDDLSRWKALRFTRKAIMPMWRYRIIKLLRKANEKKQIDVAEAALEVQYHKTWIVHFAKPTDNPWHNVAYLGRYLKKPPCAHAKLAHYQNDDIQFCHLNHKTKKYQTAVFQKHEFIERLIQHIPDKGVRMIRYYGILANRVRGKLLPIVYDLLNQIVDSQPFIGWAAMMKHAFGQNPLTCILCQSQMRCTAMTFGLSSNQLIDHHEKLANRKPIIA